MSEWDYNDNDALNAIIELLLNGIFLNYTIGAITNRRAAPGECPDFLRELAVSEAKWVEDIASH
ncbi:MAG TPA: hypothetical protein VHY37_01210 [Tepidisphaeraceae bacterium]|nr:hypothetical protein [Tepidisphaeraceae bacterium]